MYKNTRELPPEIVALVNDNFNTYYSMLISDNKYCTISRIKKNAPYAWSLLTEGQKTRLYRTAKKHRKF